MKKWFLRCLTMLMVVAMMSVGAPRVAMAAGENGTWGGVIGEQMEYENLVMSLANGATYEQGEAIHWSCSGKISPVGLNNVMAILPYIKDEYRTSKVELVLYKLEGNYMRVYIDTLFSKTFDNVITANFSEYGVIVKNLEPGTYCLSLGTEDDTVKEKRFTVTEPSWKKNGCVTVEYIDENWTVVKSETKTLSPGTHTLYNEYNVSGYEKVGDLSWTVTVYDDGRTNWEKVKFYVKQIEQNTDKVVDPVTADPVTDAPDTAAPVTKPAFPIINEYCYIPDDGNNVRSGAGTNYSILGQVNSGDWFVIYDYELGSTGKDWYKIYFNGQFGWISSGIVELNGNTEGTVNGVPIGGGSFSAGQKTGTENNGSQEFTLRGLTIKRVATRSGPGTNYTDTGSYNKLTNEWVEIRSRAWDNRNDMWWVEVYVEGRWLWTPYARFDSATIRLEALSRNLCKRTS